MLRGFECSSNAWLRSCAQAETGFLLDLPAKWISGWPQERLESVQFWLHFDAFCGIRSWFQQKKLAFGSLQRVTHETFWSENLATTGPKSVSTEAWLAMALSLVTPGRSRIQHIEMSTSERPVTGVKCRDTWLFGTKPSMIQVWLLSLMGHREWSFDSPCSGPIQTSFCLFLSVWGFLFTCVILLYWFDLVIPICFHCFLAVGQRFEVLQRTFCEAPGQCCGSLAGTLRLPQRVQRWDSSNQSMAKTTSNDFGRRETIGGIRMYSVGIYKGYRPVPPTPDSNGIESFALVELDLRAP